ncbi:MAG: PKD domain-containing protein, partial [Flavobacteriales bacterium]|nr:PKD domain-containing protein [Flavobacteriales bacterium]
LPNYACESWDFGDGTVISGGAFIYHCYAFPGTYTVCHTTCCIDAAGNVVTSTHCRDVTCTCTPDATFSYTVSGCCADFINTGFDPTLPYASCALWEFGDGTTASGIGAVNHCFPGNGVYTVCFTNCCMDNGVLITSTWCTDVTITDCCGCGPLATSFTVNNATDCCLELVADVPDPTVPTLPCVYWDFGDGSAPLFGTYVANHCFPGPGTYHVCLTDCCVNADGTYTSTVTCQDVVVTGSCCCPNADFTWVFDSSCTVQFEGPNCASYSVVTWTFGDGGTYTGINPNYTYTAPGLYNVCMTVTCVPTGGTASSTTICHDIYVPCCAAGCDTDATFDYEIVCNDVNFTGIDNGLPSGCWNWDFGDGTGGTGTVISHSYPGPGTYNVCMTVCCFDPVVGWYSTTNCQTITIDP